MSSVEDELRDIKATISSLLISNPNKSTILSLEREYKQMEGRPIPFRRFGYSSIDSFLRSMPDILNVLGSGYNATLQVIVSKKVAHIDSLISKQRSSGKKRAPRSSRFYDNCTRPAPQSLLEHPIQFYEIPRSHYEVSNPIYNSPQAITGRCSDSYSTSMTLENSRPNLTHAPHSSGSERLSSSSYDSPRELVPQPFKSQDIPATLKSSTNNTGKYNMLKVEDSTSFTSSTTSQQNLVNMMNDLTFTSNEGFNSAKTPISNFKVPLHVQENLFRLVKDHPNGIDCSMLPSLYRNKFKDEINYNKYGYRNLIQMIKDFPSTYHCFRPDCGDYKIFDKSRPLPANLESLNESVARPVGACGGNKTKSLIFPDTALPESMLNLSVIDYPPDVVKVKEIIPRQFISESVKEMDEIELHVAEVYDPSKFWIILKEDYNDLEELMFEMQLHYNCQYSKLKINEEHLEVGMFCVSIYEGQFHRALLTKVVLTDHKTNVYYVDYGTVATVDSRDIYFLANKFSYLPQQAIRARLTGIFPPLTQSPWSLEATMTFLNMVQYRVLSGQINKIDREERVLELVLCDKSRGKDGIINNILVKSKLAIYAHQEPKRGPFSLFVPIVHSIYLFPTFHELENFLVPTLPELTAKIKLGVSHDDIYPQYYEPRDPNTIDPLSSISEPVKRRKHLIEIYPNSSNGAESLEAQVQHPENENSFQLICEPAMREQHLNEFYNAIETTDEPLALPKLVKPPPGFTSLPENNQFIQSISNNTRVDLVSPNKLCNNAVPISPTPKHENAQNTTKTVNKRDIGQAITSILKEGHVVALYLLECSLKKFLITSDVTENLIKFLKNGYLKTSSDVMEEMVVDILNHFNDLQLLSVCDSIKENVTEFKFELLTQNEVNRCPSSESLFPLSSPSLPSLSSPTLPPISSPNLIPFSSPSAFQHQSFDGLSPFATPFIPYTPHVEHKVSLNMNLSELNLEEPERKFSPHPQSLQSLPKFPIPTYQLPNSSNHDEAASETTSLCNSQSQWTQSKNKYVFMKILHGKVVRLIKLNEGIYITILEMQEVTKLKDLDLMTIKKNINLICDGNRYMQDINVNKYVQLKEELQRYGLKHDDEILSLIRIEFIPEFFKLFGNVMFPKSSFQKFLYEIYSDTSES